MSVNQFENERGQNLCHLPQHCFLKKKESRTKKANTFSLKPSSCKCVTKSQLPIHVGRHCSFPSRKQKRKRWELTPFPLSRPLQRLSACPALWEDVSSYLQLGSVLLSRLGSSHESVSQTHLRGQDHLVPLHLCSCYTVYPLASSTQWTWVWANSGRQWRTGRPGLLQSMRLQRVGHRWATEQQPTRELRTRAQ